MGEKGDTINSTAFKKLLLGFLLKLVPESEWLNKNGIEDC